jgi:hypothetical protein
METDGFSGKPAVGISNVGAVGGKACSDEGESCESGAICPFRISITDQAGSSPK